MQTFYKTEEGESMSTTWLPWDEFIILKKHAEWPPMELEDDLWWDDRLGHNRCMSEPGGDLDEECIMMVWREQRF